MYIKVIISELIGLYYFWFDMHDLWFVQNLYNVSFYLGSMDDLKNSIFEFS